MNTQNNSFSDYQPPVKIVGIGDSGFQVLSLLIRENLRGVEFCAMNTCRQSLDISQSLAPILIGENLTGGLGTGGDPRTGRQAVEESTDTVYATLTGANTVVITTGLGGGTGTGASPAIAHVAKELGAFVIGIVSYPFSFEGSQRQRLADTGLALLEKRVDLLKVVQNDRLFRFAVTNPPIEKIFSLAAKSLAWQVLAHIV